MWVGRTLSVLVRRPDRVSIKGQRRHRRHDGARAMSPHVLRVRERSSPVDRKTRVLLRARLGVEPFLQATARIVN